MKHENKFRIATCKTPWNGFNLVRGHIFGVYDGVFYVSGLYPNKHKKNHVLVYKCRQTPDCYRWSRISINSDSELVQLMIDARKSSQYKEVSFIKEKPGTIFPKKQHLVDRLCGNPYKPYQGGRFTPR